MDSSSGNALQDLHSRWSRDAPLACRIPRMLPGEYLECCLPAKAHRQRQELDNSLILGLRHFPHLLQLKLMILQLHRRFNAASILRRKPCKCFLAHTCSTYHRHKEIPKSTSNHHPFENYMYLSIHHTEFFRMSTRLDRSWPNPTHVSAESLLRS